MRFSASVGYAIKAMLFLARSYQVGVVSVKTVAENERIPFKFLEQLLRKLRSAGLVISHRGKEGGYTLALSPASITFLDVYQAIEGPLAVYDQNDTDLAWIGKQVTDKLIATLAISLEKILYMRDQSNHAYTI